MLTSVIIPTLDEAARLPGLLADLARQKVAHEVIVVDGGSRDGTVDLARASGATVLRTRRGRGQQLAAGAAAAQGDVFLFLHADCRFPTGGLAHIGEALANDTRIVGGNFRLLFDGNDRFSLWLNDFYAWIRDRGLYYGDSGIFVRRSIYHRIGGIKPIALMEDYDFVRRLEPVGRTHCIDYPPLITSSRRFAGRHPAAIVAGWLAIHALYSIGLSPRRLAVLYRSARA